MKGTQFILFPLNIITIMVLGLILTLFKFSNYYTPPGIDNIIIYFISFTPLLFFYIFYAQRNNTYIPDNNILRLDRLYKFFVLLSILFFLIVFLKTGVPILSSTGRDMGAANAEGVAFDGDKFTSILNIVAYSFVVTAVTMASAFSKLKISIFCLIFAVLMSTMILSRQLTMVSFVIFFIGYVSRYKINFKRVFYSSLLILFIIIFFGALGNYRQQLHGDYVSDYAHVIGGSNKSGYILNESLFWLWIYIASPVYNLFYNMDVFRSVTSPCFALNGYCVESFLSSEVLTLTISKMLGFEELGGNLVVSHLNVSTAYVRSVVIFGKLGIIIHVLLQILFFILVNWLCHKDMRYVLRIYYSAISLFSIFSNLFITPHFVFAIFIIIIISWLNQVRFSLKYR